MFGVAFPGGASGPAAAGISFEALAAFLPRLLQYVHQGTRKAAAAAFLLEVLAEAIARSTAALMSAALAAGSAADGDTEGLLATGLQTSLQLPGNEAFLTSLGSILSKSAFNATPQLKASVLESVKRLIFYLCCPEDCALSYILSLPLDILCSSNTAAECHTLAAGSCKSRQASQLVRQWLHRAMSDESERISEIVSWLEICLFSASDGQMQALAVLMWHSALSLQADVETTISTKFATLQQSEDCWKQASCVLAYASAMLQFEIAETAGLAGGGRVSDIFQSIVHQLLHLHAQNFTDPSQYDRGWYANLQALTAAVGHYSCGAATAAAAKLLQTGFDRCQAWAVNLQPLLSSLYPTLLDSKELGAPVGAQQQLATVITAQCICNLLTPQVIQPKESHFDQQSQSVAAWLRNWALTALPLLLPTSVASAAVPDASTPPSETNQGLAAIASARKAKSGGKQRGSSAAATAAAAGGLIAPLKLAHSQLIASLVIASGSALDKGLRSRLFHYALSNLQTLADERSVGPLLQVTFLVRTDPSSLG